MHSSFIPPEIVPDGGRLLLHRLYNPKQKEKKDCDDADRGNFAVG